MQKIYLKDYKSPDFEIESVNLEFDLQEDSVVVTNKMAFKKITEAKNLFLNGEKIQLQSVKLNDKALSSEDYILSEESLEIKSVPQEFNLEIVTQFNPKENTELSGLYYSGGYLCTQCEAEGFRRITYFMDRPDVMSKYHVIMRADKKKFPVLLSNGNHLKKTDLPDGRHQAEWEDPFKKPSYLFALVAGDLGVIRDEFKTMSGRNINLEIYAPHGKQNLCHHAMRSLKKAMKWDEERFGREYDLDDYMIVSIDDFNMGAMENKGLNIFNSRLVLANENSATDQDFHNIESVVAHEYFHNWTGNRVTLRDWFHLSLKEGLTVFRDQEFSADMTNSGIQRINDVNRLRDAQFKEDAGPNSHPVRPESCYAVDNFYTATIYEKGAELIRMMSTIVGRRGFREGMDLYFSRHDGQAVTIEDFVKAIAEPNKKDWTQFRRWYSQAGTPKVEVTEAYDEKKAQYTLKLKQNMDLHIPIRFELYDSQGGVFDIHNEQISRNSEGQKIIELKDSEMTLVFEKIPRKPVISLLQGFSAPVLLQWKQSDADLFYLMTKDSDGFNRREAAQTLAMNFLKENLNNFRNDQVPKEKGAYAEAFNIILQAQDMSPAFKALMMELPSESFLIQNEELFDPENFKKLHQWSHQFLGQKFSTEFEKIYNENHGKDSRSIDFVSASRRRLKNMALFYWAQSGNTQVHEIAAKQYKDAENMSDRIGALSALAFTDSPYFEEMLQDFHRQWRKDSVVINKWFALQAYSSRADTFQRVKALVGHGDFNIKNPNNVYSLLRSFIANASVCHSVGAEAYEFLTDQLLIIDEINPQVATSLCSLFNSYKKMPLDQKAALKKQAERILQNPKLSKNTRELIEPVLSL